MTKEELAKKKGLKTKETAQTAAESLILSKPAVKEETKAEKKEKKPSEVKEKKTETKAVSKEQAKPVKETKKVEEPVQKPESTETPGRAGRPKGRPSVKVTVNVPEEDIELMNIAASIVFKGNVSSYIVSLIEKDIAANDVYKKILEMTK